MRIKSLVAPLLIVVTACAAPSGSSVPVNTSEERRLPTGVRLDPAGRSVEVGSMPLAIALSADAKSIIVSLNGWREQGIQVLDRGTGAVVQNIAQPAAFVGMTFSPDGKSLYVSGGNEDVVYRYAWSNGRATAADTIELAKKAANRPGTRYPAGLGVSMDGKKLYVAENLADSVAVVDIASGKVTQRFATERYPYGVAVAKDGSVYVSAWGGSTVSTFQAGEVGTLTEGGRISAGRHSSALALSHD